MLSAVADQASTLTAMTLAVCPHICLARVGFVQHVGLCRFPEAARCDDVQNSLRQHSRQCATLNGFNGYVTCFQIVLQDIPVPLVLTCS